MTRRFSRRCSNLYISACESLSSTARIYISSSGSARREHENAVERGEKKFAHDSLSWSPKLFKRQLHRPGAAFLLQQVCRPVIIMPYSFVFVDDKCTSKADRSRSSYSSQKCISPFIRSILQIVTLTDIRCNKTRTQQEFLNTISAKYRKIPRVNYVWFFEFSHAMGESYGFFAIQFAFSRIKSRSPRAGNSKSFCLSFTLTLKDTTSIVRC